MTRLLDDVREALRAIGQRWQEAEMQDKAGKAIPVLVIQHGQNSLVALGDGAVVRIAYPLDISPDDAAALAEMPEQEYARLLAILRRELMSGRSAFAMEFDETKKPPHLRHIRVEQRLVVRGVTSELMQRLADATQELVVVANRVQLVLGAAFNDLRASQTAVETDFHPAMYT